MIPWGRSGRSAALSYLALVAGAGLGFVSNLLIAKLLGPAGTGAVLLALTVAGIGGTFARAGLDVVALRLAAACSRSADLGALTGVHRSTIGLALLLGAAAATIIAVGTAGWQPMTGASSDVPAAILATAAAIPAASALVIHGELLKAQRQPALANIVVSALPPAVIIAGLGLLAVLGAQSTVRVAVVHAVATYICAALAALLWRRAVHGAPPAVASPSMVFLLKSGAPFLWLAVANMAIMWTDIIVLGLWTDPATVGIYGIAQRVATTLTFLLLAANSVTAPRFATLHARGDHAALQHLASRSALWLAVAATPLVSVLLLLPGKVMGFFGDAFVIGHPALQILVAGQFVNVLTGSVGYLLMMTGHERDLRNIVFVSATANVLGNLVLVPALGMIGAAIATAGSLAFMNIGAYVAVRRRLRVDTLDYLKHLAGRWRNRSDR